MGRGLPPAAAHRRRLRARRRSRATREPKYLMALLEKQTAVAAPLPPEGADVGLAAELQPGVDGRVPRRSCKTEPAWLSGVVFGPQVRMQPARSCAPRSRSRYPIRHYPDITHSRAVPVSGAGLGRRLRRSPKAREVINPRPARRGARSSALLPAATRSASSPTPKAATTTSTSSSGAALGWDPDADGASTSCASTAATSSATRYADSFAQGLLALERNWRGPLLTNAGVDTTLQQFQEMERTRHAAGAARTGASSRRCIAPITTPTRAPAAVRDRAGGAARWRSCAARAASGSLAAMDARRGDPRSRRRRERASPRLARARLRAGRGAVPEHPHAVERAALPGDLGGPRRQPRHHRRAAEQSRAG